MAEIRTHDPEGGSDLGRLVREALGDTVRPIEPGSVPTVVSEDEDTPMTIDATSVPDLPQWTGISIDMLDS